MSFKKNPTVEELQKEVELLQSQLVTLNASANAMKKAMHLNPDKIELDKLKSKWWYKIITWSW